MPDSSATCSSKLCICEQQRLSQPYTITIRYQIRYANQTKSFTCIFGLRKMSNEIDASDLKPLISKRNTWHA